MGGEKLNLQYEGKKFLVAINFIDQKEQIVEKYMTSGTVEALSVNGVLHLLRSNGHIFCVPFDEETISTAKPGEFIEVSPGEVVKNPDYITRLDVKIENGEDIERVKKFGFVPDTNGENLIM